MQPTRDQWSAWELSWLRTIAAAVKSARERAELTQRALADAAGVDRGQIANLESHADPESKSRTTELPRVGLLVRLSLVLGIPPVELLYPALPDGTMEVWPDVETTSFQALQWFSGEIAARDIDPRLSPEAHESNKRVQLARWYANARNEIGWARGAVVRARMAPHDSPLTEDEAKAKLENAKKVEERLRERLREVAGTIDDPGQRS